MRWLENSTTSEQIEEMMGCSHDDQYASHTAHNIPSRPNKKHERREDITRDIKQFLVYGLESKQNA